MNENGPFPGYSEISPAVRRQLVEKLSEALREPGLPTADLLKIADAFATLDALNIQRERLLFDRLGAEAPA